MAAILLLSMFIDLVWLCLLTLVINRVALLALEHHGERLKINPRFSVATRRIPTGVYAQQKLQEVCGCNEHGLTLPFSRMSRGAPTLTMGKSSSWRDGFAPSLASWAAYFTAFSLIQLWLIGMAFGCCCSFGQSCKAKLQRFYFGHVGTVLLGDPTEVYSLATS